MITYKETTIQPLKQLINSITSPPTTIGLKRKLQSLTGHCALEPDLTPAGAAPISYQNTHTQRQSTTKYSTHHIIPHTSRVDPSSRCYQGGCV